MGRNQVVRQFFNVNQNWTAPAGVTSVKMSVFDVNDIFGLFASNQFSSFLNTNGKLYMWGLNDFGQLGQNDVTPRSSPVLVVGGLSFKNACRDGDGHMVGIATSGLAYAWGRNTSGELGLGDVVARSSPVAVLEGRSYTKVTSVGRTTLALDTTGAAYAWGQNTAGQLGVGDTTPRSSPVAVVGGLTFQEIQGSVQGGHAVALTLAGAAYAWGQNVNGNLGVGDVTSRSSPTPVLGGLTFIAITGSGSGCAGIATGGVAYAWGNNLSGQLGVGDVVPRSSPVAVLGGLTFSKISGGGSYFLGITNTGVAYAWGNNIAGQLGVGDVNPRSSPVAVLGGLTFAFVEAGGTQAIGLTTLGVLYAWGQNTSGELGVGDVVPRSSPVAVIDPRGTPVLDSIFLNQIIVSVTPGTTYAITTLGSAAFGASTAWASGFQNLVALEYFE